VGFYTAEDICIESYTIFRMHNTISVKNFIERCLFDNNVMLKLYFYLCGTFKQLLAFFFLEKYYLVYYYDFDITIYAMI
jgi:hypothetical protein